MNEKSRDEALAHFGVKGMRWGVRTNSTTSGSPTASKTTWTPSQKQSKIIKAGSTFVSVLKWSPVSKQTQEKLNRSPIKPIRNIQEKQKEANQKAVDFLFKKMLRS